MECFRSYPRNENDNEHEIHCILPCVVSFMKLMKEIITYLYIVFFDMNKHQIETKLSQNAFTLSFVSPEFGKYFEDSRNEILYIFLTIIFTRWLI